MGADQSRNRERAMNLKQRVKRVSLVLTVVAFVCAINLEGAAQEKITGEAAHRSNVSGHLPGADPSAGPIQISISSVYSSFIADTQLDSSGGFSFTNVPPGEYILIATQFAGILAVRAVKIPSDESSFRFQVSRDSYILKSAVEWGWRGWCVRSKCIVSAENGPGQ